MLPGGLTSPSKSDQTSPGSLVGLQERATAANVRLDERCLTVRVDERLRVKQGKVTTPMGPSLRSLHATRKANSRISDTLYPTPPVLTHRGDLSSQSEFLLFAMRANVESLEEKGPLPVRRPVI